MMTPLQQSTPLALAFHSQYALPLGKLILMAVGGNLVQRAMIYSDELFDHETCSAELSIHKLFLPFSEDYDCSRHNQRTLCT